MHPAGDRARTIRAGIELTEARVGGHVARVYPNTIGANNTIRLYPRILIEHRLFTRPGASNAGSREGNPS